MVSRYFQVNQCFDHLSAGWLIHTQEMVKIVSDFAVFEKEIKRPTLTVVDYYANW
jgi:hypothetical protein